MTAHAAPAAHCLNCHYTLSQPRPAHCGHCGQETDLHPPSVHEFAHEYVGHFVALEGPLWRSLWALIFLPGRLTREYFAGRRRRYVLPLRIYLSASFVFFIAINLLPPQMDDLIISDAPVRSQGVQAAASAPAAASAAASRTVGGDMAELRECLKLNSRCNRFERQAARLADKFENTKPEQWKSRMRAMAPYAMLGMQPLFAALLLVMFAGSGRRYAEHFVFSLHTHAFWFLALLLDMVAFESSGLLALAVFAHGLVALRHVYGRGWWANLWRGLLLSVGYFLLLLLGVALLALLAVLGS